MTLKTATLTDAQWADIMQLVGRVESDLAEYVPHHAGRDGYALDEINDLERLLKGDASDDQASTWSSRETKGV